MNSYCLRCVLYLRLSDEDRDKISINDRSESIKNQEKILRDYAKENNFYVVGIYNDEDWSGSDKSRPEFNRMILECSKGNIDIVLVKTQARFARDMELIEKYVYNKFIEWNVRFITVVDKIDNFRKETKKTSQILGLTDEWYLEDTSLNIRQTFRTKRLNGEFTGSFVPYGYKRDPKNKNHLVIDDNVSYIIKKIFEDYSNGYSISKILNNLTNNNILSPLEYKLMNGSNIKIPKINSYVNNKYIDKSGSFVIRISCINNNRKIYNNLITIDILTDNILFSDNFFIYLRSIDSDTSIYYSIKRLEDLNIKIINNEYVCNIDDINLLNDDFNLINIGESIPRNTTCIISYTRSLDRMNTICYEFEVVLKENKNHKLYEYKVFSLNNDLFYNVEIRNKFKWSLSTIKKILNDEVYIGNLVQFKTTTVSYKNHKLIYNDEYERIRVNNTHEAIIDNILWNNVRNRLKENKKICNNGEYYIFSNKVFCKCCNKVFYRCGKKNRNGFSYLCCSDKRNKWSNCDNNKYIKHEDLYKIVLDKLNNLFGKYYNFNLLIDFYNSYIDNNIFKEELDFLYKEELSINMQLDKKKLYLQGLYEDRKNGFIDDNDYFNLKDVYKGDWIYLNKRLNNIKDRIYLIKKKISTIRNKCDVLKKYEVINELNLLLVNKFIDKIFIGKYDCNLDQREINIIWNFND